MSITDPGIASTAWAVTIQPDGKIIAAGYAGGDLSRYFALVRYNPNGNLDTTFGDNGKVNTALGGYSGICHVSVLADGRIMAVGGSNGLLALARYNPDGSLDSSFGGGGTSITTGFRGGLLNDQGGCAAVTADGKVLAAGELLESRSFAVARFNSNGSLDSSFGEGGVAIVDFGFDAYSFYAKSVAVQADGKVVATGEGPRGVALARFWP